MTDLEKSTQAGRFDIIEWKCNVNTKGTVILTADLHDSNVGEFLVSLLSYHRKERRKLLLKR